MGLKHEVANIVHYFNQFVQDNNYDVDEVESTLRAVPHSAGKVRISDVPPLSESDAESVCEVLEQEGYNPTVTDQGYVVVEYE